MRTRHPNHTIVLPSGHVISDERDRIDMALVTDALRRTYWAADRPPELTARSWANCLAFAVYAPEGNQLGFGRLLTDYALRAHLGDLFVIEAARGLGLGRAMVGFILGHPELATVDHWTLTTDDAHGLYARFGFRPHQTDGKLMMLNRAEQP